jgi:hypothetical protein
MVQIANTPSPAGTSPAATGDHLTPKKENLRASLGGDPMGNTMKSEQVPLKWVGDQGDTSKQGNPFA